MLTLLTLHGFTDAKPARPLIQRVGRALARRVAAGPCRFYERAQAQDLLGWTIWIPGCHLVVLNEDLLDWGGPEKVGFVIVHELGHVVLGHARHPRRWACRRREAEDAADEFAEAVTLISRAVIRA